MAENEGVSAKQKDIVETISQNAAKETLIEVSNKELLSNVNEKLAKTGVTSATEELTIAKLREVAASNEEGSALAKETLEMLGLGEASKATSIALKGLAMVGNMIAAWAIAEVLQLAIKGLDELANSVDNCKERVDTLMSSYQTALDTANSNASRVEELASDYEKLSKGVNNLGENVSLTSKEYEQYNSLVSEIADMFPTLIQGYNDQGTAILNLKGNVEGLRDAYKEAQTEAYNTLIASGENGDGNDIIKQWEDIHNTGFFARLFDLGAADVGGKISVSDALAQLEEIQKLTAEEYRNIENIVEVGSHKEIESLTDIQKEIGYGSYIGKALGIDENVTDKEFEEAKKQAKILAQTYNAEIESALSDVETLANAYLMTNDDYSKLTDNSKTAASLLVNNLTEDIANDFSSKEDVGSWVDSVVSKLQNNPTLSNAINGLFTTDLSNMSVDEVKAVVDRYINTIAKILEEDPVELKIRLGFDSYDKLAKEYNQTIENAQEKFDTKMSEDQLSAVEYYNQATESAEKYRSSLDDIYKSYNGISNVDRDIIYWDDENLEKYKSFIESWGESAEDLKGTWSTVLGSSENIDGVEVAFTAMLQTDHGLVPLDQDTFWDYFDTIFNQSWNEDGTFNADKFIKLDSEGADMMINGQMEHVANMIAAAEGQYMNGVKLTADDVIAIGSPGYDENGKDLLPGNNSKYKGNSMHEVQEWALENRYALAQLDEQAKKSNTTVNQLIADTEKFGDNTDWESWFAENVHTQEEIDKWREIAQNCNDATEAKKKYLKADTSKETPIFSDIFSLKDTEDNLTALGKISESIDTIQNAYNTLNSAIDEYNNSGSISIDTLQSIVALGDDWYDYLLDENGALKLDKESLQALTLSRLADMKAQIQQNMIDSVKKINDDASAKEYLTSTNYKTADSIEAVTDAMIDQALAEKRLLVDSGDLSQENYDLIEKKLRGDIEKSNLLVSNISLDDISLSGGSSSSKSNSKSNSKDSIDIIDFAEEKLNHLNTLIDDTQKHIEQLEGSANKNALVDSLVDINKSKMNTLEQVSDLYTRMADEYLAKIPEQYKGLAKEGGLEIDKFIGEGNSEVTDAIKNYQT